MLTFREPERRRTQPFDRVTVMRMIVLLVLSGLALFSDDENLPKSVGVILIGLAIAQPVVTIVTGERGLVRLGQASLDVAAAGLVVLVAPTQYSIASTVLVSILAMHAVTTAFKQYVPFALAVVGVIGVLGAVTSTAYFERVWGVALVLAVLHGYIGQLIRLSMHSAQRDLVLALEAARGLTHVTNLDTNKIVDVVGNVEATFGWTREEWLRLDHRDLLHPDDVESFWIDADDMIIGSIMDRTGRMRRKDGEYVWIRNISQATQRGNARLLRGISIDVTAQQMGFDKMASEASTDLLTGLGNRRSLLEDLKAREALTGHHLVIIDLNRFKEVNDSLGHEAGDRLLRVVADRFTSVLPPDHHIARLGGDEFAVVTPAASTADDVARLIDEFAFVVSQPAEISGTSLVTSLSAGVAPATDGQSDATTLLRRADIAMYEAKRLGVTVTAFDRAL